MKTKTVIKLLNKYVKGLTLLEKEAISNNENADAEHYKFDRAALEYAIKCVERSNA